jgi:hypothetical protein
LKKPKFFQGTKKEGEEKVKTPKSKKEKTLKNKRQVPFSRKKATRLASILFFSVILLSLLFNVIFFSKYQTIRSSVKAQENSIQDQLNQVKNSDMLNSHSVVVFSEDFLQHYFTIPSEEDKRKNRIETLSTYFVNGYDINRLGSLEDFNGNRELKNLQFVETERISESEAKVHFLVDYEITEIIVREEKVKKKKKVKENGKEVEKTVEETVKKEEPTTVSNSVEIVVPVTTNGKGYAVYQNPSLIERDLRTDMNVAEKELEGEQVTSSERKNLEKFLSEFFTSYGVSDEKLPFMAQVERGLQNQVFQSVAIRQFVKEDDVYKAFVDVQYQNKETSLNSIFTYELKLSKENNKYFIESIE